MRSTLYALISHALFLHGCSSGGAGTASTPPPGANAPQGHPTESPRTVSASTPRLIVRSGGSIQAAIDRARPGDVVLVEPGRYRPAAAGEAMLIIRADKNGITLRGAGKDPGEVVLDGNKRVLHVLFFGKGIDRRTRVENLTITGGHAFPREVLPPGYSPKLWPDVNQDNDFFNDGGGLMLFDAAPTIRNCRIIENQAHGCGAGISVFCPGGAERPCAATPLIADSEVSQNRIKEATGGGLDVYFGARVEVDNCLFTDNNGWGAIAVLDSGRALIRGCTIAANRRQGLALTATATAVVTDTIFASNQEVGVEAADRAGLTLRHSCFWQNAPGEGWVPPRGAGTLSADPRFVQGPRGKYFLGQRAAGQGKDSPCVDRGATTAAASKMDRMTTRTDGVPDTGVVDIGFHYPP